VVPPRTNVPDVVNENVELPQRPPKKDIDTGTLESQLNPALTSTVLIDQNHSPVGRHGTDKEQQQ
jgi:hypothetical protein